MGVEPGLGRPRASSVASLVAGLLLLFLGQYYLVYRREFFWDAVLFWTLGGLLIAAIGLGLLEIKTLKIGNMLPAIFMPLAYQVLKQLYEML